MELYNLKEEFNWRGDVAEVLAKFKYHAFRTKGYDFKRLPFNSRAENAFLKKFWKRIDLYGFSDEGRLVVYEVKARTFGVRRRPDITRASLAACQEALKLGIQVFLVMVYFHDAWNISFELHDFDVTLVRVNDGGWYRQRSANSR